MYYTKFHLKVVGVKVDITQNHIPNLCNHKYGYQSAKHRSLT